MATILLSAAGAAIGGTVGGTVAGLSSVALGRAVGATLGRVIDERLLGAGSDPEESGRVERFRLTRAEAWAPVSGQLLWSILGECQSRGEWHSAQPPFFISFEN